ncbi:hypothetical protein SHAb15599_00058 [Acinetobacter phage SH-Ab 15599]|nr:hypothetical protein SHAb15599_00058 [Acinetobacter phage SH-Ab 15599]
MSENKFLKRELKKSQLHIIALEAELEDERDENDRLNTRIIELQTTLAKRKTGDPEPLVEPPHIV